MELFDLSPNFNKKKTQWAETSQVAIERIIRYLARYTLALKH